MNMQNVSNLVIPEGEVRTIHDKNSNLLWGKVNYNIKYDGDIFQQTYTGKNLMNVSSISDTSTTIKNNNGGFTFTKVSNSLRYTPDIPVNIPANTQAILSYKIKSSTASMVYGQWIASDNTNYWSPSISDGTTSINAYFQKDIVKVRFYFQTSQEDNISMELEELMVRLASVTDDSYEPFVGGTASPNPQFPQPIQVVTGTQTVSITDGTNTQNFTVDLGSIELCKIGTYQDYIYKSGDDWYIHKATNKVVLDGSENWTSVSTFFYTTDITDYATSNNTPKSNFFTGQINTASAGGVVDNRIAFNNLSGLSVPRFYIKYVDKFPTSSDLTTWLSNNRPAVYYAIATPVNTQITDSTLISQLNAVHEWLIRYGYNATVSGNLPIIIDRTAL